MEDKKKHLLIIDANSVIHRAYHALPLLTTKKGELVNAVYGFLLVFFKAIKDFQPDYIVACFDFPGPTFRHKKYKEYKAKRPPTPKDLVSQIPKVKEILNAFSVPVFEKEGFEADDVIGTLVSQAAKFSIFSSTKNLVRDSKKESLETIIITGDRDAFQLVDKNTEVYLLRKGVKDVVLYDENLVKEKFQGLTPEQLLEFKALKGDPSDNIPGVPGIGEKTAIQLIKQFGTLENLYKAVNQRPPHQIIGGGPINARLPAPESSDGGQVNQRLRAKLEEYKEQAFLCKGLVEIKKNIPLDFNLKECQWGKYREEKVVEVLKGFGFESLIKKLSEIKQKIFRQNLKLW